MPLFKKNKSQIETSSNSNADFGRLFLREVVIFTSYMGKDGNLFVHFEKDGKNFIKANVNGFWHSISVDSRSAGFAAMSKIKSDWSSAIKLGLLPHDTYFFQSGIKAFGFTEVSFNDAPEEYSADYIFTLGRELVEGLRTGWFPKSNSELWQLFNFLALTPIRVGFFGQYKFVLKSITNLFPQHVKSMTPEYASHLAAAIGFGYGHLEGFISRTNLSPKFAMNWHMDELRFLPELIGSQHPRLKTIQYLLRKGWRFLDFLESQQDPLVATRFKTHILRGSDTTHQDNEIDEERYLQYQQLTTRIIYGESGLATRDRESRKVELGPRKARHDLTISEEFISGLSPAEMQAYKNWISGLVGKNSAVTHHALALSQAIPGLYFNWTPGIVKTLFNSESKNVVKDIWKAIDADTSLLSAIPPSAVVEFLNNLEGITLDRIIEEITSTPGKYSQVIYDWTASHLHRKLNESELKIAIAFLQQRYLIYPRNTLFIQVANQTKLQPFSQWKDFLTTHSYQSEIDLLGLYGVVEHSGYPRGILDVLDIRNEEMQIHFAQHIVDAYFWDTAKQIRILNAFHQSTKPGAKDLVWTILNRQMLSQSNQEVFLEHLADQDPTGSGYLRGISSAVALDSHKSILRYLISLSCESKDPIWRRNKVEIEKILMGWKGFPTFLWNNLDQIPGKVVEKFLKYEGLNAKVLDQVTPSYVARMSSAQIDYFVFMLSENPAICSNIGMLRAMLIAPSATINEIAAAYVKTEDSYDAHWLLMLESNLPVTRQAAFRFLESQVETKDFSTKLLMALDSNNQGAREYALLILGNIENPLVLAEVVNGLVENRNTDTWQVVTKNLKLISDSDRYKEFTNQVFLSRRTSRTVKELVKRDIEELIQDICNAVEKDTLIRMAHSSVSSDRDWALKQIALSAVEIDSVVVEHAWKGEFNV